MLTSRFLGRLAAPLALVLPALAAAPAGADATLDYSVRNVIVVQTLPNVVWIGGKSTCVRARIDVAGTVPPGTVVDALLRVFVNGVEEPYSPVYSQNGPLAPPQTGYALSNIDHTINFFFVPPASNDVEFVVEVNPPGPGQVSETDYTNNTGTSGSLVFECRDKAEVVYVPIDYRPSGGGPNLPNANLIKPGAGDNFIQAIFPVGDWDYHRSDVPSKLWTNSLNFSGSQLLNSLFGDLLMMSPQPDFIYGWVPGSLPYNGQANGIPGRAAMGNTQSIRHQRTFAHELGHLFGRSHISNRVNRIGFDVEHHLNITQGLPQVKLGSLNDIMVAGLLTNQAWVYNVNYTFFANHARFRCGSARSGAPGGDSLMIGGLWDRDAGTVELTDAVVFAGGIPTDTVPLDQANLILRAWSAGQVAGEFGLAVNSSTDTCADASAEDDDTDSTDSPLGEVSLAGFMALLPDTLVPATIERIEVVDAASGTVLAGLQQSAHAPAVELTEPRSGSQLGATVRLAWSAADADGDALKAYVRYSPDGRRMVPLASGLEANRLDVDFDALPALKPDGYFEILVTDGLRTTRVRTGTLTTSARMAAGDPPFAHVLSPDGGKTFQRGATVILHGAGWDIEDRSLEGASLVWTSDLDGVIGMGRLDQVSTLSVGTHTITLSVTDSDAHVTTDSVVITVSDRMLPAEVCQTNLGFGGPGTSLLQVCGGNLSTGTSATVQLLGAAPSTSLFLIYSDMNNPFPALGGTLLPVPILGFAPGMTDANGDWTLPGGLQGGGGPLTLYGQAIYLDPLLGVGISNAVQVDYLP